MHMEGVFWGNENAKKDRRSMLENSKFMINNNCIHFVKRNSLLSINNWNRLCISKTASLGDRPFCISKKKINQ